MEQAGRIVFRTPFIRLVLDRVRARGGDPQALLARFALPASTATDPETVVSLTTYRELTQAAAEAAREPFLGLEAASRVQRGMYGVVEYGCRCSATLREAYQRVARFIALVGTPLTGELEPAGTEGARLSLHIPGIDGALGIHGNEFVLGVILHHSRAFSGVHVVPRHVALAHPPRQGRGPLHQFFGTTSIDFGAPKNALTFDEATLDLPIASADAKLLELLERMTESEAIACRDATGFLGEVKRCVRGLLPQGAPELDAVARALHMSSRTMQRRLQQEETSFQQVVEDVREELARLYMTDPNKGSGEIATLLGYGDTRAFLRAFRRWTGLGPAAFRRATGADA